MLLIWDVLMEGEKMVKLLFSGIKNIHIVYVICHFHSEIQDLCTCSLALVTKHFFYIGETNDIVSRLRSHNSGYGSQTTTLQSLRPYALFSYICGFDGNRIVRTYVEQQWKRKRDEVIQRGIICMKQIAQCGQLVIKQVQYDVFKIDRMELWLILNFED